MNRELTLTPTEWHLMECLWENAPRTGREAVEHMKEHRGWSRSTTLTMLRRMTEKGFIECRENGEVRTYYPNIRREEAVSRETESFLDRVYHGSIGLMMSSITKKQNLTKEEIDHLYAILDRIGEGGADD